MTPDTTAGRSANGDETRALLVLLGLAGATGVAVGSLGNPVGAILAAVGVGFVVAVFLRPRVGLIALVSIHYFSLSTVSSSRLGNLPDAGEAIAVLLLVVVASRALVLGERPSVPPGIVGLLSAYAALGFAGVWFAVDPAAAFEGGIDLVKNAIIAFLVLTLVREVRDLRAAIYGLVVVGSLLVAVGLFQYATGTFSNDYWGLAVGVRQFVVDEGGAQYAIRLSGPFGLPNAFGQRIATLVPLIVVIAVSARTLLARLASWSAVGASALAVVLTFSRGAFLGLVSAIVLSLVLTRPKPTTVLSIAAIGMIVIVLMPASYAARLSTVTEAIGGEGTAYADQSIRGRTGEVLAGSEMFLDHPLYGVGFGNYEANYLDYSRDIAIDPRREERQAHNFLVEVAAEGGIVGVALVAAILAHAFSSIRRGRYSLVRPEDRLVLRSLAVSLVTFLVCGLFLHLIFPAGFWVLIALAVGAGRLRSATAHPRAGVSR